MAIPGATRVMAYLCVALGIDYYYNHKQNSIFKSIIKQTNIMAQIKIQICSNHYSGKDYYENSISLELHKKTFDPVNRWIESTNDLLLKVF